MTKQLGNRPYQGCRRRLIHSALLVALSLFASNNDLGQCYAAVTTAISPTGGTGSPASLGTVITSGTSTVPTNLCTASCVITGGTKTGPNLFHSFGNFNIAALDSARFQTGLVNPIPDASVLNILARVTGGTSNLYGNLNSATYYPSANLFLMNPAGFLFGPNATINVGGMVAFTTGDYIRLTDNARFNAVASPADALLTSAPIAAFGFLGPNAASIVVQGSTLQVAEGQTLALIGGNRTFQSADTGETVPSGVTIAGGTLSAPSGRILLASVDSAGEVIINSPGQVSALNVTSFSNLGKVTLSEGAHLDASTLTDADGLPISANGSGTVQIRAGEFVMDSSSITVQNLGTEAGEPAAVNIQVRSGPGASGDVNLRNGSAIQVLTMDAPGGDILIDAHAINLSGTSLIQSYAAGAANGGAIVASASDTISISEFSEISSFTFFSGNGGAINLSAKSMDVGATGPDSGGSVSSSASDVGNGGDIALTLQQDLNVRGGGSIGSSGGSAGAAGNITVNAGGTVTLSGLGSPGALTDVILTIGGVEASSHPGDISIHAGKFVMNNQAQVKSAATAQLGANVTITADESVALSGGSRIRITTSDQAGGTVLISGPTITLDNSSIITRTVGVGDATAIKLEGNTITLTQSEIQASSGGSGHGGAVSLNATDTVSISGQFTDEFGATSPGGLFSKAQNTGAGGNITVQSHQVQLSDRATISANTTSTAANAGNAGNILVKADTFSMSGGATITAASTGSGNAGNVTIQGLASPAESVLIDGANSGIFTDTQGTGAGGNILVNANTVTLQNGGTLSAKTSGTADTATGGTITVDANQVQLSSGATITADSTGTANAGNINVTAVNGLSMQNSSITTLVPPSGTGNNAGGGDIKITTSPAATVFLQNSMISASVADGGGGGGNISIDPQFVILLNSQILAQAAKGQGGTITINAGLFLPDATSVVNADSGSGQNGTITIQSPLAPASGRILPLPQKPLIAATLLSQRCAALAGGEFSSFTVAGRDSLPAEPSGWLSSPLALASLSAGTEREVRGEGQGERREAGGEGETPILSLRQIAPPGFLTQAFAADWSAGCAS